MRTAAGSTVEVSPQHIVWATTVSGRHDEASRGADYELYEIIPVGGKVLAAGWIEKGDKALPQLRAKGTTPAILVATSSVGEPRDWLRRLRVTRWISALFGIVLAAVGWLLLAAP